MGMDMRRGIDITLKIVCIFKQDKCIDCGEEGVDFLVNDICKNCWSAEHTECVRTIVPVDYMNYKLVVLEDEDLNDYRVFFNDNDGLQTGIEVLDTDDHRVVKSIYNDDLMVRDGYMSVALRSRIPDEFLCYYSAIIGNGAY
jgi:hypothetical protein